MKAKSSFNVFAAICIIVGVLFLLENYDIISGIFNLWPIFPLFLGWGLTLIFLKRGRKDLVALGAGVYLICFSLLAFYFNLTSWTTIADTWPIFIGFLGITFLIVAYFDRRRAIYLLIGIFLCFLYANFVLIFTVDVRLWPISLVLLGVCIFLVRRYG